MSPRYDYACTHCDFAVDNVEAAYEDKTRICPKCDGEMNRLPVATRAYKIKGDNSASTVPKKHREAGRQ